MAIHSGLAGRMLQLTTKGREWQFVLGLLGRMLHLTMKGREWHSYWACVVRGLVVVPLLGEKIRWTQNRSGSLEWRVDIGDIGVFIIERRCAVVVQYWRREEHWSIGMNIPEVFVLEA